MDRVVHENAIDVLWDYLRPLQQFTEDKAVQEIMINRPDDIRVERNGEIMKVEVELDYDLITATIKQMAKLVGKDASSDSRDAIVNARMPGGFRVAAALSPVSVHGPSICIRKHSSQNFTLEEYVSRGIMPPEIAALLEQEIGNHKNILISGGTSSGKTSMLNAMAAKIPNGERILTIEDTQELKIVGEHWIAFESNEQMGITIRDLVTLALRYRPDRIIVGEVRGAEAFDLMQALNTGHDGGFATIHANSAKSALSRLETLVLTTPGVDWPLEAIRMQIGSTFHYIVQLNRLNGQRRLIEVLKLTGYDYQRKEYIHEVLYQLA